MPKKKFGLNRKYEVLMKYSGEDMGQKKSTRGKTLGRIAALALLVICGLLIFQYRNDLSTKLTKVFASTDEDPVPVAPLSRQSFRLTVPATALT